ncbi:hypothetical protein BLNAU_5975 [Blattamonas nauphoetae]|uniref:Uncharacterized protein n=1 Tax=Blattamonas nauphoetae TaxID=2049346 RepID=A0ABQ9Y5L0_9EUKA|nr:hypothetical protein BLNAU_5975 [Blattamonas nauphoetae]
MTREVWTDGNGDVLDVSEILYPFETSAEGWKEQLEFGVSYGVLSLTCSDCTRSVLISDIVITMPDEPARIISFVSSSLNGTKDELTLSFVGSLLPDGSGKIKVKQTESDVLVEGVLTRDSATPCTVVFSTAWSESTTHLSLDADLQIGLGADLEVYTQIRHYCLYFAKYCTFFRGEYAKYVMCSESAGDPSLLCRLTGVISVVTCIAG